jgi:Uma2 family endonuclease
MSPAPSTNHQDVSANLEFAMMNFVREKKLGKVLHAPTDVRLGELASPVQPDILFIRQERLDIIKKDWVEGAPDLIVEILSPSNWLDDRRTKYSMYAQAGVREYWLVDPDKRQIEVFALRGSDYEILGRFGPGEQAASEVLSGFQISVGEVCPV